jgi:hypothetical protein
MTAHHSTIQAGIWLALVSIGVCPAYGAESGAFGAAQFDSTRLFPLLDASRDGALTKEEFRNLAGLGQGRAKDRPEMLDRIFERLDADRSGALSPQEFQELSGLRGHAPPAPSVPVTPKAGLSKLYKPKVIARPVGTWVLAPSEN